MTWWLIAILFPWWYPYHDCRNLVNDIYCFYCTTVIITIIISSPKDPPAPARFIFHSCCSICAWPRWTFSFNLDLDLDLDLRFSAKQSKDPPNDVDDWHPWVEFLSYGQLSFGIFQPILIFLELLWVCLAFSEASKRRVLRLLFSGLLVFVMVVILLYFSCWLFYISFFVPFLLLIIVVVFFFFFQISITDLTIIYLLLNWICEGGGDGGWA